MLIKKILCPTDRSENAKTGMAYAISLGREHKAEPVFLHVIKFPWRKMASCRLDAVSVEDWRSQLAVEHLLKVPLRKWRSLFRHISGLTYRVFLDDPR
jgi:hypothetical protein